jgi:hypothetical protein
VSGSLAVSRTLRGRVRCPLANGGRLRRPDWPGARRHSLLGAWQRRGTSGRSARPSRPTCHAIVAAGRRSAPDRDRASLVASGGAVFPNGSPGPVEQLQVLPLGHRQQFQPGANPFAAMLEALPCQAIVPAQKRRADAAVHAVINGDLIRRNHIPRAASWARRGLTG